MISDIAKVLFRMPDLLEIAVLDDNSDDFLHFRDIVQDCYGSDCTLYYYKTEEELYAGLEDNRATICFIDYSLGSIFGTDVIRRLSHTNPKIPCILLTDSDDPDIGQRASEAGAYEHLPKYGLEPILLERAVRYVFVNSEQKNQLSEEHSRLERVILESPNPSFTFDEGGTFRIVSHSLFNLCGLERNGIVTIKDWIDQTFTGDFVDTSSFKDQLIRDAGCEARNYDIRHANGRMMHWRFKTAHIGESRSGKQLYVTSADDISEFMNAVSEAKAAVSAKKEFLSVISHELRTPLNPIIGLTELIKNEVNDPEVIEMLDVIHSSGESLLRLIKDLLDYINTDQDKIEIIEKSFKFESLVSECIDRLKVSFEEKGLELTCSFDDNCKRLLDTTYLGDSVRIEQVLVSLIKNALKFTSEGGVEVRVDCKRCGSKSHFPEISVIDTGIGIHASEHSRIFDALYQVDSSTTRNQQGTGLGLAIARRLINRMNGEIGVRSELGKGSTFFFSIPVRPLKTETEIGDNKPASKIFKSSKILVVEDAPANMLFMRRILKGLGQEIIEANNGKEALERFSEQADVIELVLMDLQMPIMDGFEATAELRRRDDAGKTVPIVAVTANAGRLAEKLCLEAGMNDYLAKPYKPADIERIIEEHIAGLAKV